ncbi:hypothetical protein [Streptomyces anulatus]|uniref:hypothetical protein n=1 Tax=Streptomyces anulatus TaxID=1892 RepID=UPI00224CA6CE|nr:hypothetical protein [Streptomyces anulatus]MCX4504567.1 hypothetical protein [Streptomyces anulatus]
MAFLQGADVPLTAQFFEYAGGPGAVLTGVTVTVTKVGDSTPTLGPVSAGISNPANGLYAYTWTTTAATTPGDYLVVWNGVDGDLEAVQASETVTVTEASTGTWCSLADVEAITGHTVTTGQLFAASSVITLYANRSPDAVNGLLNRDLYWLKQACAWQARWQAQQPGFDQKSVVTSVSQDTTQVAYGTEWAISLAPLAARALKNLSWKGTRSLRIHSDHRVGVLDFTNEASDWRSVWHPLGGG